MTRNAGRGVIFTTEDTEVTEVGSVNSMWSSSALSVSSVVKASRFVFSWEMTSKADRLQTL